MLLNELQFFIRGGGAATTRDGRFQSGNTARHEKSDVELDLFIKFPFVHFHVVYHRCELLATLI